MRYGRSLSEIRQITDGAGSLPRWIAKLQVPRLGMTWRESDIRDMLGSGGMTGFARISSHHGAPRRLDGFILFRTMADEGEILSLAVRQQSRRRGVASDFLTRTLIFMDNRHVKRVFLEVNAANRAAIAFYKRSGFRIIGVRRGYYASNKATKQDAMVLGMTLSRSWRWRTYQKISGRRAHLNIY